VLNFLIGAILKRVNVSTNLQGVVFFGAISCLLAVQVFAESKHDLGYDKFLGRPLVFNFLKGEKITRRVGSAFGDDRLEKAVKQILDVAGANDALWKI